MKSETNQFLHSKEPYFEALADSLMKTVLLLAMSSPYPDILMAYAILQLPNLAQRIAFVQNSNCKDLWLQVPAITTLPIQLRYCCSFNAVYSIMAHDAQKAELQQELLERIAYAEIVLPDPNLTEFTPASY